MDLNRIRYSGWVASTFVLLLASTIFSSAARAQVAPTPEAKAKARELYDQGVTNYNLGHYTPALGAFESGYRIWHDASFLFNIAQCERALNEYEEAERSYRAYLRETPSLPDGDRERIQVLIQQMQKAAQAERAKQPPTGTQPPASSEAIDHQSETVKGTSTITATSPQKRRWYKNPTGWALVGGGVLCGITGTGLLVGANDERDLALKATSQAMFDSHHSNSLLYQQIGWPLLGIGAAGLVVGTIIFGINK